MGNFSIAPHVTGRIIGFQSHLLRWRSRCFFRGPEVFIRVLRTPSAEDNAKLRGGRGCGRPCDWVGGFTVLPGRVHLTKTAQISGGEQRQSSVKAAFKRWKLFRPLRQNLLLLQDRNPIISLGPKLNHWTFLRVALRVGSAGLGFAIKGKAAHSSRNGFLHGSLPCPEPSHLTLLSPPLWGFFFFFHDFNHPP